MIIIVFGFLVDNDEIEEEKVITRTERFVHHVKNKDGKRDRPVVEERTVTRVYRQNGESDLNGVNNTFNELVVVEHVEERHAQPLTDKERDIWRDGGTSKTAGRSGPDLLENSREAMIIDGESTERSDGSIVRTTTLITQHVVPAEDTASVSVVSSEDIASHCVSLVSDSIEPTVAVSTLEPTAEEITPVEEEQAKNIIIETKENDQQG